MKNKKTLLIDAGNSFLKWSFLENNQLSKLQKIEYKQNIQAFVEDYMSSESVDCGRVILVSVRNDEFAKILEKVTSERNLIFTQVSSVDTFGGIIHCYEEPHKLGADRYVAMIGAKSIAKSACIVIDSGTATTIDAIDDDGNHLGGVIFPGFQLSEKSLISDTDLLASWNDNKIESLSVFSNNTSQAISSGCLLSSCVAINGISDQMILLMNKQKSNQNRVIPKLLCGGGASTILPHLGGEYQLKEDLIMQGLRVVAQQSRDNE